jgi:hypothetical protein
MMRLLRITPGSRQTTSGDKPLIDSLLCAIVGITPEIRRNVHRT